MAHIRRIVAGIFALAVLVVSLTLPTGPMPRDEQSLPPEDLTLPSETKIVGVTDPVSANFSDLVADRERHDGQLIRVMGFLHLERESNFLYLRKDDVGKWTSAGVVSLEGHLPTLVRPLLELNDKEVIVEGVFKKEVDRGFRSNFPGRLSPVHWVVEVP